MTPPPAPPPWHRTLAATSAAAAAAAGLVAREVARAADDAPPAASSLLIRHRSHPELEGLRTEVLFLCRIVPLAFCDVRPAFEAFMIVLDPRDGILPQSRQGAVISYA